MGTSLDALNAPQSLTARRHANLPNFELPPPTLHINYSSQKFPSLSALNVSQPGPSSLGQLLTPSNTSQESSSPLSTALHGTAPFTPNYWHTGTTPNGTGTGLTPQPWQSQSMLPPKGMFSPSLNMLVRNTGNSPATSDSLPQPPYDLSTVPPFQTSLPMSAPASRPATVPSPHSLQNTPMAPSIPVSTSTQHGTFDAYAQKPPAPSMYPGSSSAPTLQSYGSYPTSSAVQSPHSASTSVSRPSPPIHQSPSGLNASSQFARPPWPSYSLPAMPGPVMSNMHSPNSQISMVGGGMSNLVYNSGYAANAHQMYNPSGQPPAVAQPPNDRPFKCDQCTQSFNRNHDLKRHRRIHLAVKPFPCNHCDKSFSRKDALKRHILVKGCGNRTDKDGMKEEGGLHHKTESVSDDGSQ